MTSPYVGEIRLFAGSFAPLGWYFCDGKLLQISDYQILYTLLGTTYGGDGQTTFGLPDLRGRVPLHTGQLPGGGYYPLGVGGGVENVTLNSIQMGLHNHVLAGTGQPASGPNPTPGHTFADQVGGDDKGVFAYAPTGAPASLFGGTLGVAGSSRPHDNMQPFLVANFIIAWEGEFPTPP